MTWTDHQGDARKQTCKMFELWLRRKPDASYEQLIKALCEVGDERVANFLCKSMSSFLLSCYSTRANGDGLSKYIFSNHTEHLPY